MQILLPQLGETVTEGTIVAWHRAEGDRVAAEDILFEIETDKVATEVPAQAAGVLRRILVAAGETVAVGTPLAEIEVANETSETSVAPEESSLTAAPTQRVAQSEGWTGRKSRRDSRDRCVSPAVHRLAKEHGIDVGSLEGSGRGGRVRRRDLLDHIKRSKRGPASSSTIARPGEVVPFNRLRRRTAEHMVLSKATSPHVLQAVEVDFSRVNAVRDAVNDTWRQHHGYGLTLLPFVAHAVCRAIGEFPLINASVEGSGVRIHADVNLAIAVDLNFDGLVAPVLARAQSLTVAELARSLHDSTQRARSGKLRPDELKGGTYTISNSGSFGTLITAPIINQPQVAILSLDAVRKRPVVIESAAGDAIAIRPVGILAQSFDHRAMDGAYSAAFLRLLKELLETSDWRALVGH